MVTAISRGKKVYGVFGSPVSHSLSPFMHNESFRLKRIDAEYIAFHVDRKELKAAVDAVKREGISGLNITLPLKEEVCSLLNSITPEGKNIGAVNTLDFNESGIKGYNTDVGGFNEPLRNTVQPIIHEDVTVFGGGGSARTVLYTLLKRYPFPKINLITRSEQQGNELLDEAENWKKYQTILEWCGFNDIKKAAEVLWESRLLVNCTPIGMKDYDGEFPEKIVRFFRPGQIAYDLIYTPYHTTFLNAAEQRGAQTIHGLEMFIHQGARAFRIWTGKKMPVKPITQLLQQKLGVK
ncbi:shikimate dehydrogenase [candidate division KSB1 bacterium]